MASVVFTALSSAVTIPNGEQIGGSEIYVPRTDTTVGPRITSVTGGNYTVLTINSCPLDSPNISTASSLREICLNGAVVSQLRDSGTTASQNLTGLYGTGIIGGVIDLGTGTVAPNSLTTVSTGLQFLTYPTGFSSIVIQNASLDAASVNHILESIVANGGDTFGAGARTVDLSGGTSAGTSALTAAGSAAVSALTGAGWAVTLNP
jgi:hypothetical protein